jgi:membrane fusion protein (multidrug efflux system)
MIRKYVLVFSGCFFLLFSGFLYAQNQQRRAPVVVSPVTKELVKKTVTLTGTVFPRTKSIVAAEVEGLVEEIVVEEGDFVEKGDKIAELGSSLYRLQLREAEAARKETEQRYLQARANLKRSEELVAKGFVAEKQFMDDRFNTEALKKNLNQHEAEVARLKDLLSKTRIFAPFSGAVAKKHTEVGEWVDKGGPLVTLIDLSRVHVTVLVPERYVTKVKVGEPALVTADALGGRSFTGRIHALIS